MTRKATSKGVKKPAKRKPVKAYIAVRKMVSVNESYTEPDRVFATRSTARKYADQLNREIRELTNPFAGDRDPGWLLSGGEEAIHALVKKLKLPAPKKGAGYSAYTEWERWWDSHYFDMTDAQRDALWDAFDEFEWYKVKEVELE